MKKYIIISIALLMGFTIKAQDIHFSQLNTTSMFNSIGSTGAIKSKARFSTHYRNQWASIGSPFVTYGLAVDTKLGPKYWRDKHFGLGLIVFKDQQGELNFNRLQAKLSLTFHQKIIRNGYLSGGIQVGMTQQSIDMSKGKWDSQFNGKKYDSDLPSLESKSFSPIYTMDMGAGILFNYDERKIRTYRRFSKKNLKTLRFGVSVYHLAQPKISYYSQNESEKYKIVLFGNTSFDFKEFHFTLVPSFLYQLKGKEKELVLGTLFNVILRKPSRYTGYYDQVDISFGGYYRMPNDSFIPAVNFNYDKFGIGVSYDVNTSELNQVSNYQGGLEFFLKYEIQ